MASPKRLDVVWTAPAIGGVLGCGPDLVYDLAREPGSPIRRCRGRLFAFRDELEAWMRRPDNHASRN